MKSWVESRILLCPMSPYISGVGVCFLAPSVALIYFWFDFFKIVNIIACIPYITSIFLYYIQAGLKSVPSENNLKHISRILSALRELSLTYIIIKILSALRELSLTYIIIKILSALRELSPTYNINTHCTQGTITN